MYQTVVYPEGIEGGKAMLHRRDPDTVLAQHGAALRVTHPFGHGFNHGVTFQVDALYLDAAVLWSWIEGDCEVQSGVKPLPKEGKTAF